MKDLEIRGAGDLLGGEQSGFINEIGFDTYQKIMNFHFKVKNSKLNYNYLRQEIIPELEACGLIEKEYVGNKMFIKITDTSDDNSSEVISGNKL
jgi:transcription-repair coupling factor (superfamily II helicase)